MKQSGRDARPTSPPRRLPSIYGTLRRVARLHRGWAPPVPEPKKPPPRPTILAPFGSAAHVLAIEIRCHLLSQFDAPSTCALLRLAARHGRVHQPGPDEIGTAVVNSEVKQLTRDDDLPEEVARLLGRRRSQPVVLEASDEDDDELQLELNVDADEDSDDAGLQLRIVRERGTRGQCADPRGSAH